MAIRTTGVRYDLIAKDSASKTFTTVGGSASKLERGLGRLAKAGLMVGAALAAGVAVGAEKGAKKAVEFEASMKKIQTQAGATAADVGTLSKQVLQLGKSTQQGPKQLSEALYHLKSVGMDNVDAMRALKTASDLAAVGGADLESTTNALAGAWRTGIRGATDFGQAASTVNAIIGAGNMSMEDLTAALGTGILPTAKTFGLTFSQVGAALALFTDEGVDSASAATRLRMSISLLAAPSKASEKQLKKIGLTGHALGEEMRSKDGLIGAISLLKDHLDKSGLSATNQAALLSRAFGGGKSSSAILSMVNNLDVLEKKQDQVNSSMGKYGPAVIAQRKTAAAQFALIRSNFEVFSIKAGNLLLPPITNFTTYLNKTALPAIHQYGQDLMGMIPVDRIKSGFSSAQGLLDDFLTGLKGPKKPTLTIDPKLAKMPQSALELGHANVTVKARPQVQLPSSALSIGHARMSVKPVLDGSAMSIAHLPKPEPKQLSQAQQFGAQLRGLISGGLGDAVKGLDWGQLGKQVGSGLATAIGWVGQHTADLTRQFIKITGQIDYVTIGKSFGKMAIPLAIGIIDNLFEPLFSLDFWKKHWLDTILAVASFIPAGKLAGPLIKVFEKIPFLRAAVPLLKGIEKIGKPISDAAGGLAKFFGKSLWEGIAKVFPEAAAVLEHEGGLFTTRIGVWGLDLLKAGDRATRFLGNGIKDGFGWVIAKIGEGIGRMIKPFVDSGTWLVKKGAEVVSGLGRGIASGASGLGRWTVDHMITPVTSRFSAAGSWLLGRGSAVVSGLRSGISSGAAEIGAWVGSHVVTPVTSRFSGTGTWLFSHGQALINGLISGTWDAIKGIGKWASTVKDKIVGAIRDVFGIHSPSRVMAELGGHMMSGLLNGLLSGKDLLHSAVTGLFHSPLDAAENLLKNGVQLPAKWASKLLSAKAPQGSDVDPNPNVASAQTYAAGLVQQLWPTDAADEMKSLKALWNAESGWKANARNPTSGAYGIPQALPPGKMASAGPDWQTNAATQIRWGLSYIRQRYGDPATAWGSWNVHQPHWYAKGGLAQFGETAWVGEKGPELMQVTPRGTRIFSNPDSMAIAGATGMQMPGYASGTVSLSRAEGSVSAAQRKVTALEAEIAALRRAEAKAHTASQRKRDRLAIMAAEERLKSARTELTAAKKGLTAADQQAKRVQGISNAIQNGFLKTLESGTASAIASAIKSLNSKLQTAGYGGLVPANLRTSTRLQSLATQKAGIASRIAAAQQYAADQSSGLGDYLSLGNIPASSLSSLISRAQKAQDTAAKFSSEVTDLRKRGLSTDILSQLGEAGAGSQLANLLSKASAKDIAQLNKLAASQKKLTVSFGQSMADAMYDSGAQAGRGFLTGLQQQEKDLQAEMDRLAAGMVTTIKKKLGIKSPSTVLRDQVGRQAAMGVAVGVRQYAHHAVREAQTMADTVAAVRARTGGAPGGRGAAAGSGAVVVHHHHATTYEIHARTADFTPQQLEVVQRRAEARQRVGRPR